MKQQKQELDEMEKEMEEELNRTSEIDIGGHLFGSNKSLNFIYKDLQVKDLKHTCEEIKSMEKLFCNE